VRIAIKSGCKSVHQNQKSQPIKKKKTKGGRGWRCALPINESAQCRENVETCAVASRGSAYEGGCRTVLTENKQMQGAQGNRIIGNDPQRERREARWGGGDDQSTR